MNVIIEGKVFSSFQKPDYTNKDTGETTKGKFIVQFMVEQELKNGEVKKELIDISVPDELASKYKGKDGQKVQINCRYYVQDKKVVFFGVV